ncbi:MAG: tRNA 4-thiouridine(8) synthase ThiI [Candidatus Omnitrophota bacterium]
MIKALALVSGGLDSTLAAKIIMSQGIEVLTVNFLSPFCLCNRRGGCQYEAKAVADQLGLSLKSVSVHEEFLKIVKNPKHGYGSHLNPCIDCRIMMFKKAKELMEKEGAAFVITGEVLGQRPMSQNRHSLNIIEKESGLEGLIVRPLSAQLLPETLPEKMGWLNRARLLEISGRSRKPQLALVKEFGLKDYPCSAGGCLLTDEGFSRRVRDLMNHGEFNLKNVELLKVGRHFRLSPQAKLVVGRDEKENLRLEKLAEDADTVFTPQEVNGPLAIGKGRGFSNQDLIFRSASIVARYCDKDGADEVAIKYKNGFCAGYLVVNTIPMAAARLKEWRL